MRIIDADGHVNDGACKTEVAKYMPKGSKTTSLFPGFDHLHFHYLGRKGDPHSLGNPGPNEWIAFLDEAEIDWTVVYPGLALSYGRIASEEWAIAACRAYNNWLYEKFLRVTPRIKGMGLIPIQDVDSAVEELRRTVNELGMLGAMLPSNGEGLKSHLGAKLYWPIYEEAEKLGCSLAVHGGCHGQLGMDKFSTYYPVHALGHPFGIIVQAAAMLCHGIFDRFPNLKVAYLEGGATWVPFFMDRLDRSFNSGHEQMDLTGQPIPGPKPGEKASEYFKKQIRDGRIFVGFDCDDVGLSSSIQRAGREPFLFASDFPHETFNAASCRKEIKELLSREDISQEDKEAVLSGNAQRFYRLAT
jgi:predicted TIM-barrel fold metal-dependent hydrolase